MSLFDLLILAGLLGALTALLVFSKVTRAIAWESLRHPFTPSRIERKGDQIVIHRPVSQAEPSKKSFDSSAGAY